MSKFDCSFLKKMTTTIAANYIAHDLIPVIVSFIEHDSGLRDLSKASPIFDEVIYAQKIRGLYVRDTNEYISFGPKDTVIKMKNKRPIIVSGNSYRYIDDTAMTAYSPCVMIETDIVPEVVDAYFVDIENSTVICFGFAYDYKIIKARKIIISPDFVTVYTYAGKYPLTKDAYQSIMVEDIGYDIYSIDIVNRYVVRQYEDSFQYSRFDILFQGNEWI